MAVEASLMTLRIVVLDLIQLGLTGTPRDVELYARRLARRHPELAPWIQEMLPPVNPCKAHALLAGKGGEDGV